VKILPFPYWGRKIRNLRSMYFAAQSAGAELVKEVASADHFLVDIGALGPGDIIHITGLRPFGTALANEPGMALAIGHAFKAAKDLGVKVVWTLHHVLTPDSDNPEEDLLIHQMLADLADVIVVPHDKTLAAIGGLYDIDPAKLRVIPSTSYLGLFSDDESDAAARERLGFAPEDIVVGYISNYATLAELGVFANAMKLLEAKNPDYRALIRANFAEGDIDEEADDPDAVSATEMAAQELVADLPGALVRFRHLRGNRLASRYRVCDLIVLPDYRDMDPNPVLTAATYSRPVLLPADSILAEVFAAESWVHTYEPGQPGIDDAEALATGIAAALAELPAGDHKSADLSAGRYARKQTPFAMSREYLRLFQELSASVPGVGNNA